MYKVKNVFDSEHRVGSRLRTHNALESDSPGLMQSTEIKYFSDVCNLPPDLQALREPLWQKTQ